MTENHPPENFDEELLSAYVDGELNDAQVAAVEQHLADDPRAAEWVAELRAMSAELQALPREFVGEDLRATIMQRAERSMLLGTAEPVAAGGSALETNSQRRWIWATVAIAASLMLSVLLPALRQDKQPVASAKPDPSAVANARKSEIPRMEAATEGETTPTATEVPIDSDKVAGSFGGEMPEEGAQVFAAAENASKPQSETLADQQIASAAVPMKASSSGTRSAWSLDALQQEQLAKLSSDAVPLTCVVHVTLRDEAAEKKFDDNLADNGIVFGAEDKERLLTERDASKDKAPAQQLVLVEAQPDQIEGVLQQCNLDTFNCPTLRVTEPPRNQSPPDQDEADAAVTRFQRFDRSGPQVAQSQLGSVLPKSSAGDVGKKTAFGRAKRLDAETFEGATLDLGLGKSDRQRSTTRNFWAMAKERPSNTAPIRVLFILQQAGEPASAGGEPSQD